jgi:hypothetical protein
MVRHLQLVDDQVIKQFRTRDLRPILDNNMCHSPEESETDEENPAKRIIVVKDLKWRSTTVSVSLF